MAKKSRRDGRTGVSVGFKLAGAFGGVVLCIVLVQLWYFPARQIDQLQTALERKGATVARVLAQAAAASLDVGHSGELDRTLAGAETDPDYLSAAVFRGDASQVGSYRRAGTTHDLGPAAGPPVALEGDLLRVREPMTSEGGARGTLVLVLSRRGVEDGRAAITETTALIGLLLLLGGVLMGFVIARFFVRRLGNIERVASRIAAGDLKHEAVEEGNADEIGRLARNFNSMLGSLGELAENVQRLAAGDLASYVAGGGDLSQAFNQLVSHQRSLVEQIRETALLLTSSGTEFLASAEQQERGAVEQSSSVEEQRRTMETLIASGRQIAEAANAVLNNAEQTQENSQLVADRIATLSAQTEHITRILQVIKDIANKSELLALNAALEGTKAGEAGRGFSLVANQMQRLAESVMGSVTEIRELTDGITQANQNTVVAVEETTKLAADTTRSARQIALILHQQQTALEEVSVALDDVSEIARATATGSKEIVSSSSDLVELSRRLQAQVGHFRLTDDDQLPKETAAATGARP
jgi:methyl-accepting chemotaxis protein